MIRRVDLIGVPSEFGGKNGTRDGPEALKSALFSALSPTEIFHTYSTVRGYHTYPELFEMKKRKQREKVHYKENVAGIANLTAEHVLSSLNDGALTAVLGGDHSVAIGSGRGALEFARRTGKKIGNVWIDAHYDAHTDKTSPSHNANGMPLASLLGFGPCEFRPSRVDDDGKRILCPKFAPEYVLHLGAGKTHCEPEEKALLDRLGVQTFSIEELHASFLPARLALVGLLSRVDLVVVSFDLDAVDRVFAPGVHLPSDGGLSPAMLYAIAHLIAVSGKLCHVDIVEYKQSAEEHDEQGRAKTASLAGKFFLRLLEK